jgi:hypothetical protein
MRTYSYKALYWEKDMVVILPSEEVFPSSGAEE